MAAEAGGKGPGLSGELFREGYRFDFFQAVRLLERLAQERARQDPRCPQQPMGQDSPPDREAVRFRALPSLSFPAAAVSQISQPPADGPATDGPLRPLEMVVAFLGLTGPQGVLPQHYTTLLLRRLRDKDYALRDFLDLFHHRSISLFYRAWEKYRLPFAYERFRLEQAGEEADLCTWCLYCLVGLGTAGLRGRLEIDDEAFLYYSGHFAHYPRSAVALEGMLADYFELPVRVQQAQGQWLTLDAEDRSLLPGPELPQGRNHQLGVSVIVGERIWDVQSKFRLRLGPVSYAQFRRLMPNGDGLRPLCQFTRAYVGPELDFDVQPVLKAAEVPWCRLGADGSDGAYLGWNTWVGGNALGQDVDDAVFFVDSAGGTG
jgi:type VI secretion system protein ImpH